VSNSTVKVLPVKGVKSLKVLNTFHNLLIGLKMSRGFAHLTWQEFHDFFKEKTIEEKECYLREAAAMVILTDDELDACLSFAADPNGVPYSKINSADLTPIQLHEIVVAVCMEGVGKAEVTLLSEDEKKK
jgi:hypothetical protein